MSFLKDNRGETIVEVLVTVAALSLVLAVSYGLANRSTLAVRQSQERSEALKLAQSQLERYKQYLSVQSPANGVPNLGSAFCMTATPAGDTTTPLALPVSNTESHFSGPPFPAACKTGDVSYNFYIVRDADATYTSHVRWARITGTGKVDEATMVYRLHPDKVCALGAPVCP